MVQIDRTVILKKSYIVNSFYVKERQALGVKYTYIGMKPKERKAIGVETYLHWSGIYLANQSKPSFFE